MKTIKLCFLALATIGFTSCKDKDAEKLPEVENIAEPISVACYEAIYEQDTVSLKINTFNTGEIKGEMTMTIENLPEKIGEIVGEFRGDTLFANYTFIEGSNKDITFKNPMAFLKRDNQLILGNGKIETTMGASYFVKGEPIDFEKVRYTLSEVDCDTKL